MPRAPRMNEPNGLSRPRVAVNPILTRLFRVKIHCSMYSVCCTSRTVVKKPRRNAPSRRLKAADAARCHAEQPVQTGFSPAITKPGISSKSQHMMKHRNRERSFPRDHAGHFATGSAPSPSVPLRRAARDAASSCCTDATSDVWLARSVNGHLTGELRTLHGCRAL